MDTNAIRIFYPGVIAILIRVVVGLCGFATGTVIAAPPTDESRKAIEADWLMQEKVARKMEAGTPAALEGVVRRGIALADDLSRKTGFPAADAARKALESIAAEAGAMKDVPAGDAWLRLAIGGSTPRPKWR